VTRKRIDQAGIRLAGELNKLFNSASAPVVSGDWFKTLANNATKGIVIENVELKILPALLVRR
jgi:hypothetical protein